MAAIRIVFQEQVGECTTVALTDGYVGVLCSGMKIFDDTDLEETFQDWCEMAKGDPLETGCTFLSPADVAHIDADQRKLRRIELM